jgi:CHAT domain-containing protein/tetratricopeptide (TPR) repeat protein
MHPVDCTANDEKIDPHQRGELYCRALASMTREQNPPEWAALQSELADTLMRDASGDRSDNIEQAIQRFGEALQVYTQPTYPVEWAGIQYNLGGAYSERVRGERAENLESAIASYRAALTVFTDDAFPEEEAASRYCLGLSYYLRIKGVSADNLESAIAAWEAALRCLTRDSLPERLLPELWADIQNSLGAAYQSRVRGDRNGNIERAIGAYEAALTVRAHSAFPEDWAGIQGNLGNAYFDRSGGERADNLERATAAYEAALTVYTRDAFPERWGATQNALGIAYRNRIRGERADNLERAIAAYGAALTVRARDTVPEQWADTQSNLGTAFWARIRGQRADNLECAISAYEAALSVYTRVDFPGNWAGTQNNLGAIYWARIRGERADNLECAIADYDAALTVYTRDDFPEHWAAIQSNLGAVYTDRIRGERDNNLERAIAACEAALTVRGCDGLPGDWAATQSNLGNAWRNRIRGERADNLERAIAAYRAALTAYTEADFPEQWAAAENNLGAAYSDRIRGERADNLERAIAAYQAALTVRTRDALPERWAATQNNLAAAYNARVRGVRSDNLECAIDAYQAALTVRTRDCFPVDWAGTQNNLGTVYRARIQGERRDNLERAIACYEAALSVRTRDAFPEDWAGSQGNLGTAYFDRVLGERADNLECAIAAFEAALAVCTRDAFPEDWARIQNNLGNALTNRVRGERTDNLERAVEAFDAALTVYTPEAFPSFHQGTQHNLGDLWFEREDWAAAHAAYAGAIAAGAYLLMQSYTETGRRAEVGETARLFAADAYSLLLLGRPAEAFVLLERGKTQLLNEALALSEVDLVALPKDERADLRAVRQTLRELEAEERLPPNTADGRDRPDLAERLSRARSELRAEVDRIRVARPGFMPTGLDVAALLGLIPSGGALVAPLFSSKGSAVFVLPHGTSEITEAHIIALDQFTDASLRALLVDWVGAYQQQDDDRRAWLTAIEDTGCTLWASLMGPVHERLSTLGLAKSAPVLLLPQGGLGLLPLHAAWREVDGGDRRYFLDDYTITYAPSGYTLSTSLERLVEPERRQRSLLAVLDPTQDLTFALAEGEAVAALFPQACCLEQDKAMAMSVFDAAPRSNYLHFACHGLYHWQDPMRSALQLAGEDRLTLADAVVRLDLRAARLVTLSACETGLSDIRQSPDEFLGLPAGFLQAGAPAVVSTLWPVDDFSTMLLMERFYLGLLAGDGIEPAAALCRAQTWLRDATAGELAGRWRTFCLTSDDPELCKLAFMAMRAGEARPKERPFSRPYCWAAFTLAGA